MRARKVLRWWHRAAAPSGWKVCRWRWPAPAQCASHGSRRTPKPGRTGTLSPRRRCTPGPARKWRDTALRPRAAAGSRRPRGRIWSAGPVVDAAIPKNLYPWSSSFERAAMPALFLIPSFAPLPLHREGGIFIKSIKEVWPLDKCAFHHNSEGKAVQSI